jgi:hypothetical protein
MAVLSAKARNKLKPSKFGLPGKDGKPGKYPEEDAAHAKDAEARATQQLAKGKLSPAQAAKIRHKAHVVLGETDSTYHQNSAK